VTFQDLILKLSAFWASQGCIIQQPLDLARGRSEHVLGLLVGHDQRAALRQVPMDARQHRHRVGHIMDRLHDDREIVGPFEGGITRIARLETHAVRNAGFPRVRVRQVDRRFVEIEPVDRDLRVLASERDAGPTHAARDIGDLRRRVGL
jgi:hypothetical protein